ncbi:MAG: hypothetical protein R3E13_05190 [Alphaproteobacteria bacterium]
MAGGDPQKTDTKNTNLSHNEGIAPARPYATFDQNPADISAKIAAGPVAKYFRETHSTGAFINLKGMSTTDLAAALNNLVESINEEAALIHSGYSERQTNPPFDNDFSTFLAALKTTTGKGAGEQNVPKSAAQEMIELNMLQDIATNYDISYQASEFESAADALGLDYEFATFGAQPEEQTPAYDTQVETLSSVFETAGGWGSESEKALLHTMNESTQGIDLNADEMSDLEIMGVEKVTFTTTSETENTELNFDGPNSVEELTLSYRLHNEALNYIAAYTNGTEVALIDLKDHLEAEFDITIPDEEMKILAEKLENENSIDVKGFEADQKEPEITTEPEPQPQPQNNDLRLTQTAPAPTAPGMMG